MIINILYKIKLLGEKKSLFKPTEKGTKMQNWTSNCTIMWIKWRWNTTTIIDSKSTKWEKSAPKLSTNPSIYKFWNKHISHPKKPSMQKYRSGSLGLWMSIPLWKQGINVTCKMCSIDLKMYKLVNQVWQN